MLAGRGSVNGLAFQPPPLRSGPGPVQADARPGSGGPGLLASVSSDGAVRLWARDADARGVATRGAGEWRECGRGDAGEEAVCLAFGPAGRTLLTGGLAGTLAVWAVLPHEPGRVPQHGPGPAPGVDGCAGGAGAGRLRLVGLGRARRVGLVDELAHVVFKMEALDSSSLWELCL